MSFNFQIQAVNNSRLAEIQDNINQKTKPPGALGALESLACKIALIQNKTSEKLTLKAPVALVFAGDHGIARQGISIAPSEVTAQMVLNFFAGTAAINVFCEVNQCALAVINAGVKSPISAPHKASVEYLDLSAGAGTRDFSEGPAMSDEQLQYCFESGRTVITTSVNRDCDAIAFGEMGIGNTSSAAAIFALLSGNKVRDCVGRGTGIDDTQFHLKQALVEKAQKRVFAQYQQQLTPLDILREVGGFEIAQMTAAMLAVAERRKVILVDGFITTAAAMLACRLYPEAQDYMVFSHCSDEQAHQSMLRYLDESPLLSLGLRLGEGTGAVMALPLLRNAVAFYNDMATFESAGVEV